MPTRQIYVLSPRQLSPETIAVAFAKTSRSPESFNDIAAELSEESSAKFHEKWVVGYGHSSVAEHAVLHLAIENVSRLAVECIESNRLASYTEKSTRYQKWDSDDFLVPPELDDHPLREDYQSVCMTLFETYARSLEPLKKLVESKVAMRPNEKEGAYDRRIRSQYIDSCRFLLPAASLANLGMTLNARVLENSIRGHLDAVAPRRMAVLDPLKVIITNYPADRSERLPAGNHPKDESMGTRELLLTREVYIDRADFREEANKKYKRLVLGGEVRLRNAYVIRCDEAVKDEAGNIVELRCSYDPDTLGQNPEGRKVRGVIHWVSAVHGRRAEVRLYDRLFRSADPGRSGDFHQDLNPDSLRVLHDCVVEPALAEAPVGERYQFEREGYFCLDSVDSRPGQLVFNRIVSLRDSWGKADQD